MKRYVILISLALFLMASPNISFAKENLPFAQTPVIFINAGLGGGIYTTNLICELCGLKYDWVDGTPTPEHLASGVGLSTYNPKTDLPVEYTEGSNVPKGTKYQTMVLVMSVPSMTTYWDLYRVESVRLNKIIEWAKNNEVKVIGMHVEGAQMRGRFPPNIEAIIDLVAPQCDMLIVTAEGNQDNKFTMISESNDIPLEIVDTPKDLVPVMQKVFGLIE